MVEIELSVSEIWVRHLAHLRQRRRGKYLLTKFVREGTYIDFSLREVPVANRGMTPVRISQGSVRVSRPYLFSKSKRSKSPGSSRFLWKALSKLLVSTAREAYWSFELMNTLTAMS